MERRAPQADERVRTPKLGVSGGGTRAKLPASRDDNRRTAAASRAAKPISLRVLVKTRNILKVEGITHNNEGASGGRSVSTI